ncbi:MAG: histidine kinase dimerization/phospho-acceptor domain-containing protein, partial [Pseudomonadota bacterium]
MSERGIGVLCCSLLMGETRRALDRLGWTGVLVATVPGQCHTAGPTQNVDWDRALDSLLEQTDDIIAVCMNCIHRPGAYARNGSRLALIDHPQVRTTGAVTQGELFIGAEATEALLSERAFMVLPGWLNLWRQVVFDVWRFDDATAQEFFRESSSRLLFLDTGIEGPWDQEMQAFSECAGIPWKRRVVGTSYLEGLLTLEFERIRAERLAGKQEESLRKARAVAADREVLVDFVTRLVDVLDGPAIRTQLRETLEMLFAPEAVEMEDLPAPIPAKVPAARSTRVSVTEDGRSLELDVLLGDGSRIRFLVYNVTFLEHMDRYLPLARITADAAALALDAARLHLREKDLVKALQEKVTELDSFVYSASHDLQSPLRSVVAFSELLTQELGDGLSDDAGTYLDFITKGTKRMNALVISLLALSRTERHALNVAEVSLERCVDDALLNLSSPIHESSAAVERGRLPRVQVDPTLVTQLYQNL